jgi:hypothetical protein
MVRARPAVYGWLNTLHSPVDAEPCLYFEIILPNK